MEIFVVRFYLFSQKRIMQRRPIQIALKILATQQTSSTPYCLMKHFQCYPISFGNSPACFQIIIKSHYGQHTTHISDISQPKIWIFAPTFRVAMPPWSTSIVTICSGGYILLVMICSEGFLESGSILGGPGRACFLEHHISSVWECIQL